MSVILPNDLLAVQFPKTCVVVGARRHKIRRVCTKGAVPDPALVAGQRRLERVRLRLLVGRGFNVLDFPDLGRVICATGRQLLDVWGEKNACDVLLVGAEVGDGDELSAVEALD